MKAFYGIIREDERDEPMRIEQHPILDFKPAKTIEFTFDGRPMTGREGDTVAAALHAAGVLKLSESIVRHRPRGFWCAIGNCSSCHMVVDGVANVKTCITPLKAGMVVATQHGKGAVR
jgi:predicted molibdopterin-dependent oxidoreductase YjgC